MKVFNTLTKISRFIQYLSSSTLHCRYGVYAVSCKAEPGEGPTAITSSPWQPQPVEQA